MSSLDKLCFILVERQKANKLRHHYLSKYYTAEKNLKKIRHSRNHPLKKKQMAKCLKQLQENHAAYRRVANLMNDQRPLLRELRNNTGAKMKYNGSNMCQSVTVEKKTYNWSEITRLHNTFVFESTVLKEGQISNPYAKELYGKETKQEENN